MFWPKILFDFIFFVHSVANETVNLTLKLDFVNFKWSWKCEACEQELYCLHFKKCPRNNFSCIRDGDLTAYNKDYYLTWTSFWGTQGYFYNESLSLLSYSTLTKKISDIFFSVSQSLPHEIFIPAFYLPSRKIRRVCDVSQVKDLLFFFFFSFFFFFFQSIRVDDGWWQKH